MKIKTDGKKKPAKKTVAKKGGLLSSIKKVVKKDEPKTELIKEELPAAVAAGEVELPKETRAASVIVPTAEPKREPPKVEPEKILKTPPKKKKPILKAPKRKPLARPKLRSVDSGFPGHVCRIHVNRFRLV